MGVSLEANSCHLKPDSRIRMKNVRHPLLHLELGAKTVSNDVELLGSQKALVISGPNAGGKTVVLKTIGIVHLMAKAGLLLPVDPESEISIFKNIMVEIGDSQSIANHQSSFSSHMLKIKNFMQVVDEDTLILVDEIANGTDPKICLLYTSPSPRDKRQSRMPSSA